jgi:phosphohistidine phosphatase SixA
MRFGSGLPRGLVIAVALVAGIPGASAVAHGELRPVTAESEAGARLVARLREGGHVLFFRHADTRGMPCDRVFVVGQRDGQRNLSALGREQSARIGERLQALGIAVERPILAGPVYRARDTAELAFGVADVRVVAGLTADDFSGAELHSVLAAHRRLMTEPVPAGVNRVLVGHRTPAIMVLGSAVGGRALPEGGAIVIAPRGRSAEVLGIVEFAPLPGGGFHGC